MIVAVLFNFGLVLPIRQALCYMVVQPATRADFRVVFIACLLQVDMVYPMLVKPGCAVVFTTGPPGAVILSANNFG